MVIGGVAHATLSARGGSQTDGINIVAVFVGNNVGKLQIPFLIPTQGLYIKLDQPVLVGDDISNGEIGIEQVDGTIQNYPYFSISQGTILNGPPNGRMQITLGKGVVTQENLLLVNGSLNPVVIDLDSSGKGTFTIQSRGILTNPDIVVDAVEIKAQVYVNTISLYLASETTSKIAVVSKKVWGYITDYGGKFVWGAFSGEGEGLTEAAGDLVISVTPILGVYGDGRDVVKEIFRLWPGGKKPDELVLLFATAGLIGEIPFLKEVDWLPDILKILAKTLKKGSVLRESIWKLVKDAAKALDLSKLKEYRQLMEKLVSGLCFTQNTASCRTFKDLADNFLVKGSKNIETLKNAFTRVGDPNLVEQLLLKIPVDDGGKKARILMNVLGNPYAVSDDLVQALKDGNKLEIIVKGINTGGWNNEMVAGYAKAVQALTSTHPNIMKMDELAHVKGSGNWTTQLNPLPTGFEFEMDTTKAFLDQGVAVVEVSRKIHGTDIDIITSNNVYELKARDWMELKREAPDLFDDELDNLNAKLKKIKDFINSTTEYQNKKFVFKSKNPLTQEVEDAIASVGDIIIDAP